MDAGQIGIGIKVLNLATGLILVLWVGALSTWTIMSFLWCDDTKLFADGGCQTGVDAGTGPSFFGNFSAFIISLYMIPLGLTLILYELVTNRTGGEPAGIQAKLAPLKTKLQLYFGFIFFFRRRTQFLIFVGILCLGNQIYWGESGVPKGAPNVADAALVGGILSLVNALIHYVVRKQHPEFDQSVQDTISSGAAAEGASQPPAYGGGMERASEDVGGFASAPAPAPAPHYGAPAPAPAYGAPQQDMYAGGDDGGTAI